MPTPRRLTAWHAAAIYLAASVLWTWPLTPHLATSIAWDLGDPMLVAWVMGWVNDSLLALLRGDAARFLAMWDAPIFYPEPLALAYSEHMLPQALFVLPLHAVTGNIILCYNVALLATFILSGLGMFLFARALTGSSAAALLAGAVFAFTPYRVDQLSHLHILSSQWMPFALYGLRRYFETRSHRALAGGVLALAALNLSSGYYLFFFMPFVVAYVLVEMSARGLLRHARTWIAMSTAGLATIALTVPFLIPYLAARFGTVGRRSYAELLEFSANVYGYVTSPVNTVFGERLDAMRLAGENSLFPGVVAVAFAALALLMLAAAAVRRWKATPLRDGWRGPIVALLMVIAAVCFATAIWILLSGGRITVIAGHEVRLRNLARFTAYGVIALGLAAALSARLRAALRGPSGSLAAVALACAFAAFMLSLGPRMRSLDEFIGYGPYALFFEYVPGFDGLRVPSRLAMVVVLWLAVAGGYAAAVISRARWGAILVLVCAAAAVAESRPRLFDLSRAFGEAGFAPLTMTHRLGLAEPVYQELHKLPRGVLLELPWGSTGWDIQYMHAQRRHGWPLVNGFTGFFPETYFRNAVVADVFASPDRAWWSLERSGASHVIVHEWAFQSTDRGKRVSQWLRDSGAVQLAATENDALFRLPGGIRYR